MVSLRPLFPLLALLPAALSGCGGGNPPAPVAPPPEFQFDDAVKTAAADGRFAEFVKLCQARAAEAQRLQAFNKANPKPRSESAQAEFEKIQGAINDATTAIKRAMASPDWSEADRKVLQYIFTRNASQQAVTADR
jgi:hypothetical protein